MSRRPLRPVHRAGGFLRALWPASLRAADREWAQTWLSVREGELFDRMSPVDRRHGVAVARRVEAALTADEAHDCSGTALGAADSPGGLSADRRRALMAAALLHDIGKSVAGLGVYGRVVATFCGVVAADYATLWQQGSGFTRRVGLYLDYPRLGAELLDINGSDPWVVAWAREHHDAADSWTIPPEFGRVLAEADG